LHGDEPIASLESARAGLFATGKAISNSRRWLIIALLFTASFINYVDRGTISVALPLIAQDLHFGPELKGVLLSAFFWSYALMQVPIGWAVDRLNLRYLYTAMFLLWSVSQGLTGLAVGLGMLIVFRLGLGVGESIYLPGGIKIVSALFAPKDRGLPTGLFNCGIAAGMAVGAPLTAFLIVRYGWRHMFLLVGTAALLWLVPWLAAFPSRLPHPDADVPPPSDAPPRRTRKQIVTLDRNLLGICLGNFCEGYYWYLFVTWLPDYLMTERHLRLLSAGLYAALPFIVFTLGQPLGGLLADFLIHVGWNETVVRKTIVTLAFLSGLFLIPATRVHSQTIAISLISGAALVGFSLGNIFVFPQSCAPKHEVGIWAGCQNFVGNLGGVVAPLATGFLIARTGSYSAGFTLGALILVAGILPYWLILGDLKPHSQSRP
jgi:MFS family permease